jgi:AcrR family transcriptional regulator
MVAPREGSTAPAAVRPPDSTRQRILEVALRLFSSQGFEKTSLRQIADELGFTKAALYYHFPSKDDIALALHFQLHQLLEAAFSRLADRPSNPAAWARFLDDSIAEMLAHPDLLLFHDRNRAALERLHDKGHAGQHEELEDRYRAMMRAPGVTLRDKVRMTSALGAVMGGVMMLGDTLAAEDPTVLGDLLREVVHDLLGRPEPTRPD